MKTASKILLGVGVFLAIAFALGVAAPLLYEATRPADNSTDNVPSMAGKSITVQGSPQKAPTETIYFDH